MGTVFNIQKFSIHDGPGIRTTVFLKGCPLRCLWCHNPEGLSRETELEFEPVKCLLCGGCATVCDNGGHSFSEENGHVVCRTSCTKCGKCIDKCVAGAIKWVGKEYSAEEVIKEVMADKIFYDTSGGGMTVSGGEPFYQPEFTLELFKLAKQNGLNTAVETSGFCKTDYILSSVPYVDQFLFDYKATGESLHRELTGVSQEPILHNLKAINDAGATIVLRCPIIPGSNDTDEHFSAIASLANSMDGIIKIDLEAYHPLGTGKAPKIGKTQEFKTTAPSRERMEEIRDFIASKTTKKVHIS